MNPRIKKKISGFTLIELTLSMTFIAILLLIILMITIQIANIYTRGITIKGVNQLGQSLISEFTKTVAVTTPFDIADTTNVYKISSISGVPQSGRLCTGNYSYIWNLNRATGTSIIRYRAPNSGIPIRLVKIYDPYSRYCTESNVTATGRYIDYNSAVELLNAEKYNLVLHDFSVSSGISMNNALIGQRLYNIDFVIGTNESGTLQVSGSNTTCKTGDVSGSNPLYCAINRYSILVRAGDTIEMK